MIVDTRQTLWPLLYFHGDDSCHVLISNVSISRVRLTGPADPDDPRLSTQVCTGALSMLCTWHDIAFWHKRHGPHLARPQPIHRITQSEREGDTCLDATMALF